MTLMMDNTRALALAQLNGLQLLLLCYDLHLCFYPKTCQNVCCQKEVYWVKSSGYGSFNINFLQPYISNRGWRIDPQSIDATDTNSCFGYRYVISYTCDFPALQSKCLLWKGLNYEHEIHRHVFNNLAYQKI